MYNKQRMRKIEITRCKSRIEILERTRINAPTEYGRMCARKVLVQERRHLNKLLGLIPAKADNQKAD